MVVELVMSFFKICGGMSSIKHTKVIKDIKEELSRQGEEVEDGPLTSGFPPRSRRKGGSLAPDSPYRKTSKTELDENKDLKVDKLGEETKIGEIKERRFRSVGRV
jgi:hypothetical protein